MEANYCQLPEKHFLSLTHVSTANETSETILNIRFAVMNIALGALCIALGKINFSHLRKEMASFGQAPASKIDVKMRSTLGQFSKNAWQTPQTM